MRDAECKIDDNSAIKHQPQQSNYKPALPLSAESVVFVNVARK